MKARIVFFSLAVALLLPMAGCKTRPPTVYGRIYIETFPPEGEILGIMVNTKFRLYDESGTLLAESTTPGTGFDDLDYTTGLEMGYYYIEVFVGKAGDEGGDYGIWVLSLASGAAIPASPETGLAGDAGDADGAPEPWNGGDYTDIALGEAGYIVRKLADDADSDWFRLLLPR